MEIKEIEACGREKDALIKLSAAWEEENICYGYRRNGPDDLAGRRIFAAMENGEMVGYLFGKLERSKQMGSVMPEGTACFELEELYVKPGWRSAGVGSKLFRCAEERIRPEADFILLSAVSKNYRALLRFYVDELGMELWSARLFKPLGEKTEMGERI